MTKLFKGEGMQWMGYFVLFVALALIAWAVTVIEISISKWWRAREEKKHFEKFKNQKNSSVILIRGGEDE